MCIFAKAKFSSAYLSDCSLMMCRATPWTRSTERLFMSPCRRGNQEVGKTQRRGGGSRVIGLISGFQIVQFGKSHGILSPSHEISHQGATTTRHHRKRALWLWLAWEQLGLNQLFIIDFAHYKLCIELSLYCLYYVCSCLLKKCLLCYCFCLLLATPSFLQEEKLGYTR